MWRGWSVKCRLRCVAEKRRAAVLKRFFDIAFSAFGLLLAAPFFICVGMWIKLDSPGPIFFRQQRVGLRGAPFEIHKFRTMTADASQRGLQITVGDDVRITRAGQFLRRCKLDELPQLIDVLLGTMSLVGPRPEVPKYVAMYPAALREKVLSVRPGITDPASLEYRDEAALLAAAANPAEAERTYIEQIMPAKLKLSIGYVEGMSLTNDVRLIWATIRHVWMR
jgi:lipopolysaccharide/colanic/teichoic acid biosynthesis glycosyltransferase